MSPADHIFPAGRVQLLDVTAEILEELLDVAVTDAAPDDVTPPLGDADGWNPDRIRWFRDYHRALPPGWTAREPEGVGDQLRRADCRIHPAQAP